MKSAREVPRNRRQVYNIKISKMMTLLSVMAMCKESMGKGEDFFVQIVTSAPKPICILCTNSQLNDIEKFCADPDMFKLLSVDPTFNLGDFSVTVTSYCNLLLQNHRTGDDWAHARAPKKSIQLYLPVLCIGFSITKSCTIISPNIWN